MSKVWYLKRIDLLSNLNEDEMEEVDQLTTMHQYKRGGTIFFPGDPADIIYMLKSGRVKISKLSLEGKEVTLAIVEPGEIFGEMALVEGERETYAEAIEDAMVCAIRRPDFERLLQMKPDLNLRVTKLIGLRRRQIESKIEDLLFKDVPERLASVLLNLADRYGTSHPMGRRIDLKITHRDLANLIGSTRETTSLTLGDFRRQDILNIEGRKIIVHDRPKLEQVADGHPMSLGASA